MGKKNFVLALILSIIATGVAYAAPVKLVDDAAGKGIIGGFMDGKLLMTAGAEYDNVFKRELEENVDVEFQSASGELALQYDNRVKAYVTLGQAMSIEETETDGADTINYDIEDTMIWGVGLAANLYEVEGFKVFTDLGYRTMEESDYKSITYNGTVYNLSQLGVLAKASWEEWHLALGVSKKIDIVTAYGGVRFSQVEATTDVSIPSISYNAKADANGKNDVGVFLGAKISPLDNFSIDIQGRFIDETAMTIGATLKF